MYLHESPLQEQVVVGQEVEALLRYRVAFEPPHGVFAVLALPAVTSIVICE